MNDGKKKYTLSFWHTIPIVTCILIVIWFYAGTFDTSDLQIVNDSGSYTKLGSVKYKGYIVNNGKKDISKISIKYICYNKYRQTYTFETKILFVRAKESLYFEVNGTVDNTEELTCSPKIGRYLKED